MSRVLILGADAAFPKIYSNSSLSDIIRTALVVLWFGDYTLLPSMSENTTIWRIINYTKKWWLLGCHRRAERLYSTRGSNDGNRVLISQSFFIDGKGEDKGLIHKHNPFISFRLSHLIFWEKEYSEEQLKIKRHTYNNIYRICELERYITKEAGRRRQEEVVENFPTVSNERAYNISGFPLGYLQGLFLTYEKVWLVIGALVIAIIGSSLFASIFIKDNKSPTINVYPPNITMPEIKPDFKPIINIYPNK